MREKNIISIKLFIASGAETKPIRDKIIIELKKLSHQHEKSGFDFQVLWWEDESAAISVSGRSQDEYNKLINDCDMVAVVIKNTLGKYTEEEFNHAYELFKIQNSPKVVVYVLPTSSNNDARYVFLKRLREDLDYFPCEINNDDQLILRIIGELIWIKNDLEADLKSAKENAEGTISRLDLNSDLTKEAVKLIKEGDFKAASKSLDMDKIHKLAKNLSTKQKEVAEAFVLKAKIELTDVKNKDRFINAEKLFEEALNVSQDADILYEYAQYFSIYQNFGKAEELYEEVLKQYRNLSNINPVIYNFNLALTLNDIGICYRCNGNKSEAEKVHKESIDIFRNLSKNDPENYIFYLIRALDNHANLIMYDYAQSEKEFEEALELCRVNINYNPSAYKLEEIVTLSGLASLHNKKDYLQAEKEHTLVIDLICNLAKDYPDKYEYDFYMAMELGMLAHIHCNKINNYLQAEDEYKKAAELFRNLIDKNPAQYIPLLANILDKLSYLHRGKMGNYQQAENELREVLELYRRLADKYHSKYNSDVALVLGRLASVYMLNEDYIQAEESFKEALKISPDIIFISYTLNMLAILYKNNKDYTQAEEKFKESLDIYRMIAYINPDTYYPYVSEMLGKLAILHIDTNQKEQAKMELKEALEIIVPFYDMYPKEYEKFYDEIKKTLDSLL